MIYDVIIIGAGAAGLMTAIQAAQGGLQVLLLEGQKKVGAKILMSGGTRCNVTNKAVSEKDFNSGHIIYVRNILRSFSNEDAIEFFKDLGVDLVLEPTGKYFPSTNSGKTILEALLRKIDSAKNITLLCEYKVKSLSGTKDGFVLKGDQFHFNCRNVVLTTGGLSYPTTGSDGTGYRLAQSFGHSMVETVPALTPLTTKDNDLKSLSGITLDVRLTLLADGKKGFSCRDSFLFAHFGFSGPAALDISRHFLKAQGNKQIIVNFIPEYDENSWGACLAKIQKENPRKTLKSVLVEFVPQRLADVILKKAGIEVSLIMNQLDKASRQRLIDKCVHYPLDVTGVLGYSKAEVTAGGIDLAEINPKTLESRLMPGLFFAGEIVDVDGRIGGFNFQWAWASGHTVAQALIGVPMSKKIIKTDKVSLPVGPYNQGVSIGNLIYTAGQIPLDRLGNMVSGGIKEQTQQVLENVKSVVEAGGSSLEKVVKATVYLKDLNDFAGMNEIYGQYFKPEFAPARTTIQVARIPKDSLVEIEVVAHI